MRFIPIYLILIATYASAQVSPTNVRPEDRPVDLQVTLSFDDNTSFRTVNTGQNTAGDAGKNRSDGGSGKHEGIGGAMHIRVLLQDNFGASLDEQTPNGEGRTTFRVRN